jgi:hypothetical protein
MWFDSWRSKWAVPVDCAAGTRRWRPGRHGWSGSGFSRSNNGFGQRRCRRGRVDGLFGTACCNKMDAEHWLRQRIRVLSSGGADDRVTVKSPPQRWEPTVTSALVRFSWKSGKV